MSNRYEHLPAVEDLTSEEHVYRTRTYTTAEETDAEYLTTGLFDKNPATTIKKHDCKVVGTLLSRLRPEGLARSQHRQDRSHCQGDTQKL